MKLIKQLDWFIKRQKRTYVIAIILLIITGVVDMLPPWIIGQAIDAIREAGLPAKVLVGGAVLTQEYADKAGADCIHFVVGTSCRVS